MENGTAAAIQQRDITVVTAEIKDICAQAQRMLLIYAVEIGRRLVEAKEILPHGAWGEWLKKEVQFSQSTANKHMKIFEAYGSKQISLFGAELNSETFTNLSYSQALKLLAVPEDERENFVKDNDIANKSVREIERLVKQLEEKDRCVEGLKNGINELQEQLAGKEADINAAYDRARVYEEKAEQLELQIAEISSIPGEVSDEEKEKIRAAAAEETKKELQGELADLRKQIEGANNRVAKAERQRDKISRKIEKLKAENETVQSAVEVAEVRIKNLSADYDAKTAEAEGLKAENQRLAAELARNRNDDIIRLNVLFEMVQKDLGEILDIINGSQEAAKFKNIIRDTVVSMLDSEDEKE